MAKKIRIGIVGLNRIIVNSYTVLWTNYIVRSNSVKFLYGTDSYYFDNLIRLLRGEKLNKRLYISFIVMKNKLRIEMYPSILLERPSKTYFKLIDSIALFLEDSNHQFNDVHLLRYVYSMASKRMIFSRKIRKPTAIIKFYELSSNKVDNFIKNKFTKFKIFKFEDFNSTKLIQDKEYLRSILERDNDLNNISRPLVWLLSKK